MLHIFVIVLSLTNTFVSSKNIFSYFTYYYLAFQSFLALIKPVLILITRFSFDIYISSSFDVTGEMTERLII